MSSFGLLDSIISIDKSTVSTILASMKVKCLLASNIVLVFVFSILTMMCLCFSLYLEILVSWMWDLLCFLSVLKKNAAIICQILLLSTSLSLRHSHVRCFHEMLCVSYSLICFSQHFCSPCFYLIFSINPSSSSLIFSSATRNLWPNISVTMLDDCALLL